MGRIARVVASIPLFLIGIFFVYAITYVVRAEVLPALAQGTLSVNTNTMILNRVWNGNEIYLLLMAYAVLACSFAYGGYRILRARR